MQIRDQLREIFGDEHIQQLLMSAYQISTDNHGIAYGLIDGEKRKIDVPYIGTIDSDWAAVNGEPQLSVLETVEQKQTQVKDFWYQLAPWEKQKDHWVQWHRDVTNALQEIKNKINSNLSVENSTVPFIKFNNRDIRKHAGELSGNAFKLYMYLRTWVVRKGSGNPITSELFENGYLAGRLLASVPYGKLMTDLNMARATLRSCIQELDEKGYIKISKLNCSSRSGACKHQSVYQLGILSGGQEAYFRDM